LGSETSENRRKGNFQTLSDVEGRPKEGKGGSLGAVEKGFGGKKEFLKSCAKERRETEARRG